MLNHIGASGKSKKLWKIHFKCIFLNGQLASEYENRWEGFEKSKYIKNVIILNLNISFTSSPNFIIILLYWFSWKQTIDNIFIKIINHFKALKNCIQSCTYFFCLRLQYGLAWHRLPWYAQSLHWESAEILIHQRVSLIGWGLFPLSLPACSWGQLRPVEKTLSSSAMEGLDVHPRTTGFYIVDSGDVPKALEKVWDNHHNSGLKIIFWTRV